jgi:hypothetical protein
MKKVSMKIALAAVMIAVGTLGLRAQTGQGGSCLCGSSCTTQLTDEQKAILADLCEEFQMEMAVLRTDMRSATTAADKLAIRQEMTALRDAHLAEVKALLDSWGIPVSISGKKGTAAKNFQKKLQSGAGSGVCDGTGPGAGKTGGKVK